MAIDIEKLWVDGGYGKDNPLERSIERVRQVGRENNVPDKAVDSIISSTFIGLSNGDTYPLDKCRCGCGTDKSGTDITHHMVWRVLQIGDKIKVEANKLIQNELNTMIEQHMKVNKMRPLSPWMDWDRSQINRLRKWAFRIK